MVGKQLYETKTEAEETLKIYEKKHDYCQVTAIKKNNKFYGFMMGCTPYQGEIFTSKRYTHKGIIEYYNFRPTKNCQTKAQQTLKKKINKHKKNGLEEMGQKIGYITIKKVN
jgi:hypothetical protein